MSNQYREKLFKNLENETELERRNPAPSKLEAVCLKIIEFGTYVALFAPLVISRSFFFPYVSPKTIFFRIVVDVIFIAYILLAVLNRKYLPKFNIFVISITVFLGILILTSFTGVNFLKSFWSTFERMTGLLTFFHLYIFFLILISVFKERKYWERILTVSILVGVFLTLYVFTQEDSTARGAGTIGNISFLAAYLLFDIFFAISLFLSKRGAWKIFYGITLIIILCPLFFSSSELPRGGIAALFIGLFILGLSYMVFSQKKILRKLAPIVLIFVILIGIGISQTNFFKTKMFDIKDLPGRARQVVWEIGLKAWQERFWLGWGLENFNYPFNKYFNPELPLTTDVWYDRVHNIILDIPVQAGILGLLSYLGIFGIAIFKLFKICPKISEEKNLFLPLGMIAILTAYFIQNIFVFDMISSYIVFFLSLAFIHFLVSPQEKTLISASPQKQKTLFTFFGALLIILTIFTFYFGNVRPARASQSIINAISTPLKEAIPLFQKTIEISPIAIFEAPEQFSRYVTPLVFNEKVDKEILKNALEAAAKELEKNIAQNPPDFRAYLVLGRQYNDYFMLTQDGEALKSAETYLNKAVELSPRNQQVYWSLAQTKLSQGDNEEAVDLLQKAVDLEPRYTLSYWYLATIQKILGNYDLALETIKEAEKAGLDWKNNLESLKMVIEIYQNLQDDNNLVPLYQQAIKLSPQDFRFPAGLAVTYANLGQFDKAKEFIQKAITLTKDPSVLQELQNFLNSLPK